MDVLEELSYEIIRPAINLSIWLIPWDNLQNIIDSERIKQIISNYMPINPDESYVVEDKRRYFGKLWCKTGDYITNGRLWEFLINEVPEEGLLNNSGVLTYAFQRIGNIRVFVCGGFSIGDFDVFNDCIIYKCAYYEDDDVILSDVVCIIYKSGDFKIQRVRVKQKDINKEQQIRIWKYDADPYGIVKNLLFYKNRKLKKNINYKGPRIIGYHPEPIIRQFNAREMIYNKPSYKDILIRGIDRLIYF